MSVEQVTKTKLTPKSAIRRLITPFLSSATRELRASAEATQLLIGKDISLRVRSLKVISSLQDVEFKVSSQWGEDGIIDWLIERAAIPQANHTFIEFGVEKYREANTRFLLQNRNWRGFIMDGRGDARQAAIEDGLYWKYELTMKQAFITRENVNQLIASSGFSDDLGLLSIDVDGNDYWIWEVINVMRPILCICEFNAVFGDLHPISIPYKADFHRTDAHFSNLYYGASLAALKSLALKKGYRFVGTNSAGNNAFFVREDYAERFVDTSILNIQELPSTVRESIDRAGSLTYIGGLERWNVIKDMPVVNTETGKTARICDLGPVYSDDWLKQINFGKSTNSSMTEAAAG
ncbi:hypothetical protein [Acidicapsa ligni]|uniref:hypothetical protein n=1 Tax=Acidicapsa ligni TaxID=542300 RepID=UPI0021E0A6E0|nr:hypothetical protein [Acidicapsa ligni]